MSQSERTLAVRERPPHTRRPAGTVAGSGQGRQAQQRAAALLCGVSQVRSDVSAWDHASRATRKLILQRFCWLHEEGGAGQREADAGTTGRGATTLRAAGGRTVHDASAEHKEALPLPAYPTDPSMLAPGASAGPSSFLCASLESLYGPAASLLLLRVSTWLRLSCSLPSSSASSSAGSSVPLLCLRALRVFVQDASGGTAFVQQIVEAGGIGTILAIINQGLQRGGAAAPTAADDDAVPPSSPSALSTPLSSPSISAEIDVALLLLLSLAQTSRGIKESLCAMGGIEAALSVLLQSAEAAEAMKVRERAKQLLCQLGLGNPRYEHIVHAQLHSVLRSDTATSTCKRMVLQASHFLITHGAMPSRTSLPMQHSMADTTVGGGHAESIAEVDSATGFDAELYDADSDSAPTDPSSSHDTEAHPADPLHSLCSLLLSHHLADPALRFDVSHLVTLLLSRHGAELEESARDALTQKEIGHTPSPSASTNTAATTRIETTSNVFDPPRQPLPADVAVVRSLAHNDEAHTRTVQQQRQSTNSAATPTSSGTDAIKLPSLAAHALASAPPSAATSAPTPTFDDPLQLPPIVLPRATSPSAKAEPRSTVARRAPVVTSTTRSNVHASPRRWEEKRVNHTAGTGVATDVQKASSARVVVRSGPAAPSIASARALSSFQFSEPPRFGAAAAPHAQAQGPLRHTPVPPAQAGSAAPSNQRRPGKVTSR